MPHPTTVTVDANETVASVAHRTNEVIAIYPITPASPIGEHCDEWSVQGRTNLWGMVPEVVEMQSEAGAAGMVHGSIQAGVLTTTFTASQGLLLMLPKYVKDRRRARQLLHARCGKDRGDTCAFDIRRSF